MPAHAAPKAEQTPFPDQKLSIERAELKEEVRTQLGQVVCQYIDVNRGLRSKYDAALDIYNAMYEMRTAPRNVPWPNAANIVLPMVATGVDELVSRVTGAVFQPRLFTMRGNDPLSSQYAHVVEQFYNGEFDRNSWYEPSETAIHLATRDGVGISEILWKLSKHQEFRVVEEPDPADPFGLTTRKALKQLDFVDYDAPFDRAVEVRDFLLIPNYATDPDAADACAVRLQMSEQDIEEMVEAGIFKAEDAEYCLSYASEGRGELSTEEQSPTTYTISGQIVVADTSIAGPAGVKTARGPLVVYRYHTRQFDLNGDGKFEENVVWVHHKSRHILGWMPFPYWGKRPFFPLSLYPRANRFYGFGVPQRGRGLQEEANAIENGKLDWMDQATQPMRWYTKNCRFREEDRRYGPDAEIEVSAETDFGFVKMPDVPQSIWAEADKLQGWFEKVTGAPQAQAQVNPAQLGTQQRSARAAQISAAMMGMQSSTVIRRIRAWMLRKFKYMHSLYQQYAPDQIETIDASAGNHKLVIPKEILGLNYTPGIAGMGGPLDKEQRRNDMMLLTQFLMQTPLVQGNIPRIWQLCRLVAETFDVPEITAIIGTMEEAQQQAQMIAQAQQQQQKQQLLLAILNHGKTGTAAPPGRPPGGKPPAPGLGGPKGAAMAGPANAAR